MVYFVTCVKHPENSHSYEDTWKLLQNTLHSVCNQNDKDFQVLVMCNKILDNFENDDKIFNTRLIELDWDAPTTKDKWQINAHVNNTEGMRYIKKDRGSKYSLALCELDKLNPSSDDYVMFFDADDFLSPHLSGFLNTNPTSDIWGLYHGWKLYKNIEGKLFLAEFIQDAFFRRNGSTVMFKLGWFLEEFHGNETKTFTLETPQSEILDKTNKTFLEEVLGEHQFSIPHFYKKGKSISYVPFHGAIHNLTHGENHSGRVPSEKFNRGLYKGTNVKEWNDKMGVQNAYYFYPPKSILEEFSVKLL